MSERSAVAPGVLRARGVGFGFYLLLVVATLLLLVSAFAVWVNRVALNTDRFVSTSTALIEDRQIRDAVATRAVDELFGSVDVEAEIETQLPADFKSLSGPATAGLREASYRLVARALEQPALQRLWAISLEQSHETLVDVLEDGGGRVTTDEGVVALELEPIVLEAADRIGIRDQVEDKLPENIGRIEVLRSDELDTAQNAFQLLKTLAWLFPLLTLGAFLLAAWLAHDRRRAVRAMGVALLVVGLVGIVAVNLVGNYLVDGLVAETQNRAAADSAWDILTDLLRSSLRWLAAIGVLFVVAVWLAGPGARALAARRALVPVLRDRRWAYAALAALALLFLLAVAVNDFTSLLVLVVLVCLAALWIELMRRQALAEFPGLEGAPVLDELRARALAWWAARPRPAPATPAPAATAGRDLAARLADLADLHARGELTDEEYAGAKARVIAGA